MALEIERKYLEVDFDSLRRRLRQYGAQGGDVHLERNRIYDLPDGSLRAGHHLLRLRSQEWPDHAQNVLTLKLPPVSAPDAAFKVREERETPVTDAAQMHSILEGLGYVVRACYEKIQSKAQFDPRGDPAGPVCSADRPAPDGGCEARRPQWLRCRPGGAAAQRGVYRPVCRGVRRVAEPGRAGAERGPAGQLT